MTTTPATSPAITCGPFATTSGASATTSAAAPAAQPGSAPAASPTSQPGVTIGELAADLAAETSELTAVLSRLKPQDWDSDTPAHGWTIRDQVTHLAFFDDATILALTDQPAFDAQRMELLTFGHRFPDVIAAQFRHLPGGDCLDWFLRSREALLAAYRAADPRLRLPWYGPNMGLVSSVTGRLMETWAHGQDILDTLGERREPTARLRHIVDLGVRTFAFCFRLRGRPVPEQQVRVELTGPGGIGDPSGPGALGGPGATDAPRTPDGVGQQRWTWGPEGADNRVEGDAEEFCLVVTQRRNVADTGLTVTGPVAAEWIAIAQAFAGAATDARPPGSFPPSPNGTPSPGRPHDPGRPPNPNGSRS